MKYETDLVVQITCMCSKYNASITDSKYSYFIHIFVNRSCITYDNQTILVIYVTERLRQLPIDVFIAIPTDLLYSAGNCKEQVTWSPNYDIY